MDEHTDDEIEAARNALSDARILLDGGGTDGAVVNRLYYAAFHAAQAALYAVDEAPSSHAGVLSMFGEELVLAGEATREHGRLLNELYQYRERADYGYGTLDVDVSDLLDRTEQFVEDLSTLVTRLLE